MSPAPSFEHAHVGSLLVTLFEPFAKGAGLVGSLDFTLGSPGDFRVPDLGLHRGTPSGVWLSTAAIVVEVRSPDDESYAKLDFYFAHEVEEVLIVELSTKTIHWYVRGASEFEASDASALLGVSAFDVAGALGW